MIRHRPKILAMSAVLALALPAGAAEQSAAWPTRLVTLVVPAPAGGPTDIIGRLMGQALAGETGQSVVVENRSGAGNTVGTEYVARAKPDGYTLTVGSPSSHAIAPAIYPKLGYDPVRDFSAVILTATAPLVLVVHPTVPARNVREFAALAKARPGQMNFGSGGSGTTSHLTGELLNVTAGIRVTHVPYRGSGPATTDLIAGHIEMMFHSAHLCLPHVRSGRLRALGVTSRTRTALLPEVPTLDESGLRGFEVLTWYGLLGPAGVPRETVARINQLTARGMGTADMKARLAAQGLDPVASTPEEFATLVRDERARWAPVVKASGAKAD